MVDKKAWRKAWRERNKQRLLAYARKYRETHKEQRAANNRDWHHRNRLSVKRRHKKYHAVRLQDRRKLINDLKMRAGCRDCGYNKAPEALHFDHVRGIKLFNVASTLNRAWHRTLREIEKCEVVCANCHSIRTFGRIRSKEVK